MPGDLITKDGLRPSALWDVRVIESPALITGYLETGEVGIVICTSGNKEVFVVCPLGCGWTLVEYLDVVHRC